MLEFFRLFMTDPKTFGETLLLLSVIVLSILALSNQKF